MRGYLVNDALAIIPGSRTFWHDLLEWFPWLEDQTGGYTPYPELAYRIATLPRPLPDLIIRNASFFPPIPLGVPTISLLQDVLYGQPREAQLEVCRRSAWTVVNSTYTASLYPELTPRVIPLGIDFTQFVVYTPEERAQARTMLGIPEHAICFVGAGTSVKGWAHVQRLIRETELPFVLVMKDDTVIDIPGRVKTFTQIPHAQLVPVLNACSLGFCPSVRETQHLAGIEMGACGLPLVTSDVGAYYRRSAGPWGMRAEPDEYVETLTRLRTAVTQRTRESARSYWECRGFTREACRQAWEILVEGVVGAARPD